MNECQECGKKEVKGKGLCNACLTKDWRKRNPNKVKAYAKKRYERDKEKMIKASMRWQKENPERFKKNKKKADIKFKKSEKGKVIRKRDYQKHKEKNHSRGNTWSVIYGHRNYKALELPKEWFLCQKCNNKKVEIHHEVYPITKKDIIKAIKEKKIYCLCNRCHNDEHGKSAYLTPQTKGEKNE